MSNEESHETLDVDMINGSLNEIHFLHNFMVRILHGVDFSFSHWTVIWSIEGQLHEQIHVGKSKLHKIPKERGVIIVYDIVALVSQRTFHVHDIRHDHDQLVAAVYLQVSIVSQALIFVTRSRSWSFCERPGTLLLVAFCIAQTVRSQQTSALLGINIYLYPFSVKTDRHIMSSAIN